MTARDVVVIGSGHNALIAACYLARAGLDVEVIERDTVIGGAVSTVERFPGIRMDRGSSAHIMIRHTGIIEELELARHGLRYVDMDPWGFVPSRDGAPAITFWSDVERTCASIERACGVRDAAAYRRFVADWLPRNRVIFEFFQTAPTLPSLAKAMVALARRSRGRVPGMVRELLGPADAVLERYFQDERLRSALAWMAAQSGPPSHEPATADLLGWLTMLHDRPPGRPAGGSGELTQAMARALTAHGGTLVTGDPAVSVEQDAAALRVTLGSGRTVIASQVVSGTHAWTTAGLIEQSCPPAAARLRTTARAGNGIGMVLRLATSAPPAYLGDDGVAHRAMALLCDDRVELRRCYGEFLAGRAPSNPAALVMCPTVDDPSLAPDGIHTVTVWGQWHAYELRDESWDAIREREAAKLIDVVERHAPGFRDSIHHTHIQSPVDIETEIGMHRGNVMHLEMTLDQMFSLRPTAIDSAYRVAGAPGLYLTGASTHPGGGVFGASGRSAAKAVLTDRRRRRNRPLG